MTIVASLTNSNYFYFWDKTCKQKNPIRTPNNLLKSQAVEEEHHNVFYVKNLYFCSSSWIFSSFVAFVTAIRWTDRNSLSLMWRAWVSLSSSGGGENGGNTHPHTNQTPNILMRSKVSHRPMSEDEPQLHISPVGRRIRFCAAVATLWSGSAAERMTSDLLPRYQREPTKAWITGPSI